MQKIHSLILFAFLSLFSVSTYAGIQQGGAENNDNTDNSIIIARIDSDDIEVTIPSVIYTFTDTDIKLKFKNPEHTRLLYNNNKINFIINGEDATLSFVNGECVIKRRFTTSDESIAIYTEEFSYKHNITPISLLYIIIPTILILSLIIFLIARKKK